MQRETPLVQRSSFPSSCVVWFFSTPMPQYHRQHWTAVVGRLRQGWIEADVIRRGRLWERD